MQHNSLPGGANEGCLACTAVDWLLRWTTDARRVLNDKGFGKTDIPKDSTLSRVMGSSLVSADGDKWKAQRRYAIPSCFVQECSYATFLRSYIRHI
jgi:hypothetical protein